jgi:hypothetical protein
MVVPVVIALLVAPSCASVITVTPFGGVRVAMC